MVAPTYVAECVETRYRGTLGALMQFQVTFGALIVYAHDDAMAINDAVNWEWITLMSMVVPSKETHTIVLYGNVNTKVVFHQIVPPQ